MHQQGLLPRESKKIKMNKSGKILVLTLAVEKNPWLDIETNGQRKTWNLKHPPDIEFLRYSGTIEHELQNRLIRLIWNVLNSNLSAKPNPLIKKMYPYLLKVFNAKLNKRIFAAKFKNGQIVSEAPEGWSFIGVKTISAFNSALENSDFDFLFRINTSSYLNVEKLKESLLGVKPTKYYAGVKGIHKGQIFASGCGYILSRDLVQLVVDNFKLWNHALIDDVAIGELLTNKFDFQIQEFSRIDVDSVEKVRGITAKDLANTFLFRCKTEHSDTTISIMEELHIKIQNT
jgi:hypothetical protein